MLRRISEKSKLPSAGDREAIFGFVFIGCLFLGVGELMKKNQFRTTSQRVEKMSVDVEREERKSKERVSAQVVTANLVHVNFFTYVESTRNCISFACDGLISHSLWKSDLLKKLASFVYSVLISLPKEQVFISFSVACWVGKEPGTAHVEEYR